MSADINTLIKALRCSGSPESGDCMNCEYRLLEEVDPELAVKSDIEMDGKQYWLICDCDRIVLEAADVMEEMSSTEYINFLISLVDDYIRRRAAETPNINDAAFVFPLRVANSLYSKLPKEEQKKIPEWIIVDDVRFQNFLKKRMVKKQDV